MRLNGRALMAGGARNDPATYITSGKRSVVGDSTSLGLSGAAAGDQIVILSASSAPPSGTWSASTLVGGLGYVYSKALDATDLLGLAYSAYPWVYAVYRGPIARAARTASSTGPNGKTISGFAKSPLSSLILGFGVGNTSTTAAPGYYQAGWTNRQTVDGSGLARLVLADLSTSNYVDNASVDMSASSNGSTVGELHELLNGL